MRSLLSMAATAAVLLAVPPVGAATITQTLPAVQDLGDLRPFDLVGARFDSSLGTLVSVAGELTGTVTPSLYRSLGPFPETRLTTQWSVGVPGLNSGANRLAGTLPDQVVTPTVTGGGRYTGSPLPVDLALDFADPSAFVGASSPPRTLVLFGFRADTPDLTTPSGGESDLTRFDGKLVLTYTYDAFASGALSSGALASSTVGVPEPPGALMLGLGLLVLVGRAITTGRASRVS